MWQIIVVIRRQKKQMAVIRLYPIKIGRDMDMAFRFGYCKKFISVNSI